MAVLDGSNVWVQTAGTLINGLSEKSLSLQTDEIDITTQDSAGYKEFLAGQKSGVLTFGGKDDESDTKGYDELFAAWVAGASVTFAYGSGIKTTGGRMVTGSAIITNLENVANMNSEATYTCSLRITGTPALATSTTTVA